MRAFYDSLRIEFNRCPPGCSDCEAACAAAQKGSAAIGSVISSVNVPELSFSGALTCSQCGHPGCIAVCPTGALWRDEGDGVVRVAEEKCIGCALCTLGCQYGGIRFDAERNKSFKCDRCDGAPKCVEACKHGVLTYEKNRVLQGYLRAEDVFVHGTPLCAGCPAELALRWALRVLGADTFVFGAPGCAAMAISGFGTDGTTTVPSSACCMTNVPATMTGVKRHYRSLGQDVRVVAFVGDGTTADIGFQPLSGAAERGENIIYICYDNEGYMNTGGQRSGTTPLLARTNTSPIGKARRGKEQRSKNVPLIMAAHRIPYVATTTIGYLEDYAQKLRKAMAVMDGMAYIHLLSPCPTGWQATIENAIELSRLAVQTNSFPLWEAEYGEIRLTLEVQRPEPVADYLRQMGRYSHLTHEEVQEIQESVDANYAVIRRLASSS